MALGELSSGAAFGPVDYSLFGLFLLISLGVGFYYAWEAKAEKKKRETAPITKNASSTTNDFLVGSRNMPIFPVALSVLATFQSGITLLGTPEIGRAHF